MKAFYSGLEYFSNGFWTLLNTEFSIRNFVSVFLSWPAGHLWPHRPCFPPSPSCAHPKTSGARVLLTQTSPLSCVTPSLLPSEAVGSVLLALIMCLHNNREVTTINTKGFLKLHSLFLDEILQLILFIFILEMQILNANIQYLHCISNE